MIYIGRKDWVSASISIDVYPLVINILILWVDHIYSNSFKWSIVLVKISRNNLCLISYIMTLNSIIRVYHWNRYKKP